MREPRYILTAIDNDTGQKLYARERNGYFAWASGYQVTGHGCDEARELFTTRENATPICAADALILLSNVHERSLKGWIHGVALEVLGA